MRVASYSSELVTAWNDFVGRSKNGTFLFHRSYMEYHADRFADCSLMVLGADDQIVAVLPASRRKDVLVSHEGLTYGGFVSTEEMTTGRMLDVFEASLEHVRDAGINQVVYKCVPHLYHSLPAEEDGYALFRLGAVLTRRDVSSAIDTRVVPPLRDRRRRALRKAERSGLRVEESTDFSHFWPLLEQNLHERHGRRPVHSLEEIELLAQRFPQNIRLFRTLAGETTLAGVVLYVSTHVCHVQYSAASEEGRECGAQDLALTTVLDLFRFTHRYIDLGISTEQAGQFLNEGLIDYKEGFGARAVNYDTYQLSL